MKKLTFEELIDIADEIKKDMYPESNENTRIGETMAGAILVLVVRFMEVYQERIVE